MRPQSFTVSGSSYRAPIERIESRCAAAMRSTSARLARRISNVPIDPILLVATRLPIVAKPPILALKPSSLSYARSHEVAAIGVVFTSV